MNGWPEPAFLKRLSHPSQDGWLFHGISLFAVPCYTERMGMLTLFVHPKICSSPLLVYVWQLIQNMHRL
jgi:hypothetical protein